MGEQAFAAHGYGAYFCLSTMDRYHNPHGTWQEGLETLKRCIFELQHRFIVDLCVPLDSTHCHKPLKVELQRQMESPNHYQGRYSGEDIRSAAASCWCEGSCRCKHGDPARARCSRVALFPISGQSQVQCSSTFSAPPCHSSAFNSVLDSYAT